MCGNQPTSAVCFENFFSVSITKCVTDGGTSLRTVNSGCGLLRTLLQYSICWLAVCHRAADWHWKQTLTPFWCESMRPAAEVPWRSRWTSDVTTARDLNDLPIILHQKNKPITRHCCTFLSKKSLANIFSILQTTSWLSLDDQNMLRHVVSLTKRHASKVWNYALLHVPHLQQ